MSEAGWTTGTIKDACLVGDGAHAKIPRVEDGNGVDYLMAKNFKNGGVDTSSVEQISQSDFERHFRASSRAPTKPVHGDVLVSIIGTLGEPYIMRKHDVFGLSSSVAILRPNLGQVQPDFLYYWMRGPEFQNAVYGIKGGVAQNYVSLEMIRSLPLRWPGKTVQAKIVGVLAAYDDLVDNNTRRIAVLAELARSLYREWFVDLRFPGHGSVEMVESERGLMPAGWTYRRLGEALSQIESGSRPRGGIDAAERGIPSIGAENIVGLGQYDFAKEKYISRTFFDAMRRGRIQHGDVLLYKDGAHIGRRSMFRDGFPHKECAVNEHVFIIRANDSCSQNYLFFWLDLPETNRKVINLNANAAQPGLNQPGVKSLPILLPSVRLLRMFDDSAEPILALLFNLAKRNLVLRMARDLLLPRLISGELDVSELDIDTGELGA